MKRSTINTDSQKRRFTFAAVRCWCVGLDWVGCCSQGPQSVRTVPFITIRCGCCRQTCFFPPMASTKRNVCLRTAPSRTFKYCAAPRHQLSVRAPFSSHSQVTAVTLYTLVHFRRMKAKPLWQRLASLQIPRRRQTIDASLLTWIDPIEYMPNRKMWLKTVVPMSHKVDSRTSGGAAQ